MYTYIIRYLYSVHIHYLFRYIHNFYCTPCTLPYLWMYSYLNNFLPTTKTFVNHYFLILWTYQLPNTFLPTINPFVNRYFFIPWTFQLPDTFYPLPPHLWTAISLFCEPISYLIPFYPLPTHLWTNWPAVIRCWSAWWTQRRAIHRPQPRYL